MQFFFGLTIRLIFVIMLAQQFAQKEEWTILCDTLGSRLLTVGNTLAATLCYICAGNIDKIVEIWSRSLMYGQDGRSYVDLLQVMVDECRWNFIFFPVVT